MDRPFAHEPVLRAEVCELLAGADFPGPGGVIVDGTLGGGGHTEALLRTLGPGTVVVGIDRDRSALTAATRRLAPYGDRFRPVHGDFRDLATSVVDEVGPDAEVRGILLDLGVSSPQLDVADRGFSYAKDAPLDMRMDTHAPRSAADIVNEAPEDELRRIISTYGEERFAGRIARAITTRRAREPFSRTTDLAAVVRDAVPAATRRTGPHPARRTFQALRIEVNDELGALRDGLDGGIGLLAAGGRIAVISYHSLEDRIVKQTFKAHAELPSAPRGLPAPPDAPAPDLALVTRKPVVPGEAELAENPRSDSAKLRVAQKLATRSGA